jgi:hypothetical protein
MCRLRPIHIIIQNLAVRLRLKQYALLYQVATGMLTSSRIFFPACGG